MSYSLNTQTPVTNSMIDYRPGGSKTLCHHYQSAIQVGPYKVHVSASRSMHDRAQGPYEPKDTCVYLDPQAWSGISKVPVPYYQRHGAKIPIIEKDGKRVIYVRWPDMGVIGDDRYLRLVRRIARELEQGRSVEIGCIGAHGRTGALLAGVIAEVEGLTGSEAIAAVRERHCSRAVESHSQVALVYRLTGETVTVSAPRGSKQFSSYDETRHYSPIPTSSAPARAHNPNSLQSFPSGFPKDAGLKKDSPLTVEDRDLVREITGVGDKDDMDWWQNLASEDRQWWREFMKITPVSENTIQEEEA